MMRKVVYLLPAWALYTFIASGFGSEYVRSTLDCWTPATLTQACGVVLFLVNRHCKPSNTTTTGQRPEWSHVVLLGVLQLLSILLTLGSFAASSVSHTYILRTLEPVFSLVLCWFLWQRCSSFKELVLVCLVMGSIGCVVHSAKHEETNPSGSELQPASSSWQERRTATVLALAAALCVSSRSIVSKAFATTTGHNEVDLFLASCVPGLILSMLCQVLLWVLFGAQPWSYAAGNTSAAVATATLFVAAFFQCAYSTISFKVLQLCPPVLHAVLNVTKRLLVVVVGAILTNTKLTALQMVGLVAANVGTIALSLSQKGSKQGSTTNGGASLQGNTKADLKTPLPQQGSPKSGQYVTARVSEQPVQVQVMERLAILSAVVVTLCVLCLAAVPVAFAQSGRTTSSHVMWSAVLNNKAAGLTSSYSKDPVWTPSQFVVRDARRIQCLRDLHHASKARLEPHLSNLTGGVALYDVAVHVNLGDSILWDAAARLVTEFHQSTKVVCALHQYGDAASRVFPKCDLNNTIHTIGKGGVILLHAGGNWGDLWPLAHKPRVKHLQLMAQYFKLNTTDFKVVQLPMTIDVHDTNYMAPLDIGIKRLPWGMFTFQARSASSAEYAKQHYPNVNVIPAPDLVWSIGPIMPDAPIVDVLLLMRGDKEAGASEVDVKQYVEVFEQHRISSLVRDWGFTPRTGLNYSKELSPVAVPQFAASRTKAAAEVLSKGKIVITNRLHAAIVSNLLGRPVIWIDTQQKKLAGVRNLSFSFSPEVCTERNFHSKPVASIKEAVETALDWLSQPDFVWNTETALDSLANKHSLIRTSLA